MSVLATAKQVDTIDNVPNKYCWQDGSKVYYLHGSWFGEGDHVRSLGCDTPEEAAQWLVAQGYADAEERRKFRIHNEVTVMPSGREAVVTSDEANGMVWIRQKGALKADLIAVGRLVLKEAKVGKATKFKKGNKIKLRDTPDVYEVESCDENNVHCISSIGNPCSFNLYEKSGGEVVLADASSSVSDHADESPVDMVNHPPHYTAGGSIECIQAIRAALTPEEWRGYIKGQVIKYTWREKHKGGDEDLKKAEWYLTHFNKESNA